MGAWLGRQQQWSPGTQVIVFGAELCGVEASEVVPKPETSPVQLEKAVSVIGAAPYASKRPFPVARNTCLLASAVGPVSPAQIPLLSTSEEALKMAFRCSVRASYAITQPWYGPYRSKMPR